MSKLNELLSTVLGVKPEEVEEKLKSEDVMKELDTKLADYKFLSQAQEEELFTNRVKATNGKSLLEMLPESQRIQIYNVHKGSVLDSNEKKIQEKYGTKFVRGADFNTTEELVDLILADKSKGGNVDADKLRADHLREKQELVAKYSKESEEKIGVYEKRLQNKELQSAWNTTKGELFAKDETPEVLKTRQAAVEATFERLGYKLQMNETGDFTVLKENGDVATDPKTQKPLELHEIFTKIGTELFGTTKVPNGGRGGNDSPGGKGGVEDYSIYKTDDEYMKKLIGEGLVSGSPAFAKKMDDFYKVRTELKPY